MTDRSQLFAKYDVPVPRYTSYPTVPQWHTTPTPEQWVDALTRSVEAPGSSMAVYVHVPFCESLCSFCGCNTVITRDHGREEPYIDLLLAELDTYVARVPSLARTPVRQLHLGGGTPTFLSQAALGRLVDGLRERLPASDASFEGSIEVDPRVTSPAQLEALAARGFTRLSLGVQDFDAQVQALVNRRQPLEVTANLLRAGRALGYTSTNFDLIYGLPGQSLESMATLAREVIALAPDRLAIYSFARVPWIKPAQRRFRDDQVPAGAEKRALYEAIRAPLLDAGYLEIGLDHFARPEDSLAHAAADGTLHRNFMGYTDTHTTAMLALGVSGISETADCYHQSEKVITIYEKRVRAGEIPTLRGHLLSDEDRRRREKIAHLMTGFGVELDPPELAEAPRALGSLLADGLVHLEGRTLVVPPEGRAFLRNAAAFFDEYLQRGAANGPLYSTSV
jgi:oxygen-independent coproporphyrinogen-3 oxidase